MTEFSAVSLRIETVGEREAMNALNDLDKRGRTIVEGVSAATGRAMGDIAAAYDSGSKRIRQQLQNIADDHYTNIKAMEAEQAAARKALDDVAAAQEAAAAKAERSTVAVSRALETMARTGKEGGRSLDTVIAQLATGFGLGGPIVGAIGIATVAIAELFAHAERASKKAAQEMAADFTRIAHMDVKGQGETASLLYSGDPNEYGLDADGKPKMGRFGVPELLRQQADFQKRAADRDIVGGPGGIERRLTADAVLAAEALKRVNAELERRNSLLPGITTAGGTITAAGTVQAAQDQPGFVTDQIKSRDAAQKQLDADAKRRAKEAAKEAEAYQRELLSDARDVANQMVKDAKWHDDYINGLLGIPSKQQLDAAWKAGMFALNESISEAIKNDPLLKAQKELDKRFKEMGSFIQHAISTSIGDGLVAGFEAAFSGKGLGGAFQSLTATVLGELGGFMEQLGEKQIIVGSFLEAFTDAVSSLNGPAAIAAGVGLIAAGAAMKAVAGSIGHHGGAGGSSGGYSSSAGLGSIIDRGIINPNSYSQSDPRSIPNKASVTNHFTVIGQNDPVAQRQIAELIRRSDQRGKL